MQAELEIVTLGSKEKRKTKSTQQKQARILERLLSDPEEEETPKKFRDPAMEQKGG